MKIPPRIILPVLLAAACAGGLMAFLWVQLTQSAHVLHRSQFDQSDLLNPDSPNFAIEQEVIDTSDESLILLRQGDIFALRGDWALAEEQYGQSVRRGGGLPALRKLAQAQMQRRDISGAKKTVKKMKTEGARSEDILLLETIIKLRTGELVEARDILVEAEDSPQKHYAMALLLMMQNSHDAAANELKQTISGWDPVLRTNARTLLAAYEEFSLFPEGSDIHLTTLIARALAQVQECEIALPLLIKVTTVKDDYRDAWIVQGYCELITERTDQAVASLEHAYGLDPQKPEIQYFLARAYAARHEYQNAITFLEYALTNGFQPQAEVRRMIANNALELGKNDIALQQYDYLTADPNANLESFSGFVSVALAIGKQQEALEKAELATKRWEEDVDAYILLGDTAQQIGDNAAAKKAYEKALKIDPKNLLVKNALSKL